MDIVISNSSQVALYEQIKNQIRTQIVDGTLQGGDTLPSIRSLAKELKVSIITVKRAYEDLEKEGLLETIVGKGTFISSKNKEILRDVMMYEIESKLEEIIKQAKIIGITLEEGIEIFKNIYEEI